MKGFGIILQARKGSTRLPGKMAMNFFDEMTLLEVILKKLSIVAKENQIPLILATTTNAVDDELQEIAESMQVKTFRGSESDVLNRFISCSKEFELDRIIRVCGDNPFLLLHDLRQLLKTFQSIEADYVSFKVNGKPSILTHFGLWAEAVTLEALERTSDETSDSFYHEHVTNFIYTHSDKFKVQWIVLNDVRFADENIRLTIDTEQDFNLVSHLYKVLGARSDLEWTELYEFISKDDDIKSKMQEQIQKNTK